MTKNFFAGSLCPEIPFTISVPNTADYVHLSRIKFICKTGYTRLTEGIDTVICSLISGRLQWDGNIEDCVINYCENPGFIGENAEFKNVTYGSPPIEISNSSTNTTAIFYENATLSFKCHYGYLQDRTESPVQICVFPAYSVGRGFWTPNKIQCLRMN